MVVGKKILSIFEKDNIFKKVLKNTGIILSGTTVASALNLISLTIIAKQLGPDLLAILVLAQTYAVIVNDLLNVRTWESMIKFGGMENDDDGIINTIKTNLFLDLVSAIVAFIVALSFLYPVMHIMDWNKSYSPIFLCYTFTILFNITTFTIGIPRFFDKFDFVAKLFVWMALLKLTMVLIAMMYSNKLNTFAYISLSIEILINLSLITFSLKLLIKKYGRNWLKTPPKIDKNQLRFIFWTYLRSIFVSIHGVKQANPIRSKIDQLLCL